MFQYDGLLLQGQTTDKAMITISCEPGTRLPYHVMYIYVCVYV